MGSADVVLGWACLQGWWPQIHANESATRLIAGRFGSSGRCNRGGASDGARARDPADLTDREAATAWGYGRPNHMINSGQILFEPQSRPLKRSQLALAPPSRAMLGPFALR